MTVLYRSAYRHGRRWLHSPSCASCQGTGDYETRDRISCSCGAFYDEAPQAWRDMDAAALAALPDTHQPEGGQRP